MAKECQHPGQGECRHRDNGAGEETEDVPATVTGNHGRLKRLTMSRLTLSHGQNPIGGTRQRRFIFGQGFRRRQWTLKEGTL